MWKVEKWTDVLRTSLLTDVLYRGRRAAPFERQEWCVRKRMREENGDRTAVLRWSIVLRFRGKQKK